mmetsp:Transcript_16517/g.14277  ORF Transcript_16517/g.14277 Transcript_16517/m.14277 type:complete len:165 (+) Transcript_16517:1330-1824(+)
MQSSPALGSVNFSPGLFNNNNLFNKISANPGSKNFSPQLNFLKESPKMPEGGFFGQGMGSMGKVDSWGVEWTPEGGSRNLPGGGGVNNMSGGASGNYGGQQFGWGGGNKSNSPQARFGLNNSAFLKDGRYKKDDSPTTFLKNNPNGGGSGGGSMNYNNMFNSTK